MPHSYAGTILSYVVYVTLGYINVNIYNMHCKSLRGNVLMIKHSQNFEGYIEETYSKKNRLGIIFLTNLWPLQSLLNFFSYYVSVAMGI